MTHFVNCVSHRFGVLKGSQVNGAFWVVAARKSRLRLKKPMGRDSVHVCEKRRPRLWDVSSRCVTNSWCVCVVEELGLPSWVQNSELPRKRSSLSPDAFNDAFVMQVLKGRDPGGLLRFLKFSPVLKKNRVQLKLTTEGSELHLSAGSIHHVM